jgi:lipopolysaccharide biosynthesis glycosyltransferase
MQSDELIRIFVGADRSQKLAIDVLEHSIKRHTKRQVEVIQMVDLPVPIPKDPRNLQRTGFSFSRFCIPKLAGYKGRAIYMDADMLVFHDIEELWELPFQGAKVLIQTELDGSELSRKKENAPTKRLKQCAVMLLDCERLTWDVNQIVGALDKAEYTYEQLMMDLCILSEDDIGYKIPFSWNSLEHYDAQTRLIHYTDMGTQPWVSTRNTNADLWLRELRLMLTNATLSSEQIKTEISLGYFRPSLARDLRWRHVLPKFFLPAFDRSNQAFDLAQGFVAHKHVYEQKKQRQAAVREYARQLDSLQP